MRGMTLLKAAAAAGALMIGAAPALAQTKIGRAHV